MGEKNRKELFKEKANLSVDNGFTARKNAFRTLNDNDEDDERPISEEEKKASAASLLANSGEHFFKAPIIDKDLGTSKLFINCKDSEVDDLIDKHLKSPSSIQALLSNDDPRKGISLTRSSTDECQGGHDLFALYSLQRPAYKALINHEFLTRDGDIQFNWIVEGILTSDVVASEFGKTILMPSVMLDKINENNLRYAATHANDPRASQKNIDFLVCLTGGLKNIMNYLYPRNIEQAEEGKSRLEIELGSPISEIRMPGSIKKTILRLDNSVRIQLENNFSTKEFDYFMERLCLINERRDMNDMQKGVYRNIYSNLSIYLKDIAVRSNSNLLFDDKVFERIEAYCNFIVSQNLFSENATQFKDSQVFKGIRKEFEQNKKEVKEIKEEYDQLNDKIISNLKTKDIDVKNLDVNYIKMKELSDLYKLYSVSNDELEYLLNSTHSTNDDTKQKAIYESYKYAPPSSDSNSIHNGRTFNMNDRINFINGFIDMSDALSEMDFDEYEAYKALLPNAIDGLREDYKEQAKRNGVKKINNFD